jgi:hypothetical protein
LQSPKSLQFHTGDVQQSGARLLGTAQKNPKAQETVCQRNRSLYTEPIVAGIKEAL